MSTTRATIEDVQSLVALVNSAYRGQSSKKGWTTESDLLDGQRIDEDTLKGYFDDEHVSILKYTDQLGQVIGCVYLEQKNNKLYLGMLSVSPELQTAGIGKALLNEAEIYAGQLNCKTIEMTVITLRHELISYYERRGYRKTGLVVPFHHDEKFGKPRQLIELLVMEKLIAY